MLLLYAVCSGALYGTSISLHSNDDCRSTVGGGGVTGTHHSSAEGPGHCLLAGWYTCEKKRKGLETYTPRRGPSFLRSLSLMQLLYCGLDVACLLLLSHLSSPKGFNDSGVPRYVASDITRATRAATTGYQVPPARTTRIKAGYQPQPSAEPGRHARQVCALLVVCGIYQRGCCVRVVHRSATDRYDAHPSKEP